MSQQHIGSVKLTGGVKMFVTHDGVKARNYMPAALDWYPQVSSGDYGSSQLPRLDDRPSKFWQLAAGIAPRNGEAKELRRLRDGMI